MSFIADQEDNPFVISPFYSYLPRRLAGTDLNFAIAKNSLYADPLVPYLPELIERKGLIYPVGCTDDIRVVFHHHDSMPIGQQ